MSLGRNGSEEDALSYQLDEDSKLRVRATRLFDAPKAPLTEFPGKSDADFPVPRDANIGISAVGNQWNGTQVLQNAAQGVKQLIGQAQQAGQPGVGGGGFGGGGGPIPNRKPSGGLSLDIELTKSGRAMVFTKAGGDPKLALSIRPTSSSQWSLRLLWSMTWAVIFLGIYYTLGRPEWKREFFKNLPYGLILIGIVVYLTFSSAGFLAFLGGLTILLCRQLPLWSQSQPSRQS